MRYIKLLIVAILLTFTVNIVAGETNIVDVIKETKVKQVSVKAVELIKGSTNIQETITNVLYAVNKNYRRTIFTKTVTNIVATFPDQAAFTVKEAVKLNDNKKFNTNLIAESIKVAPEQKDNILIELQNASDIPNVTVYFGYDAFGNPAPTVGPNQIAPVTQGTTPERRHPAKFYIGK